jgi:hypothetical protein
MTRAGFEPALPKETVLETVALDLSANESMEPPAGLEPAVYRLEVCRLIHWATGAEYLQISWRSQDQIKSLVRVLLLCDIYNATIMAIARSINSWLRCYCCVME